jgi:hypothetical protein
MADPELVRVLDYIMNRCDEASIEAVAAAVVRRRRDLALFGGIEKLPDSKKWAQNITSQMNIGASIDEVKGMVRNMAVQIIKQQAPELGEDQIAELTAAWIPDGNARGKGAAGEKSGMPPAVLETMVRHFVSFSLGKMTEREDKSLRAEMGAWPDRYWQIFPQVIKLVVRDFLTGETGEKEFEDKLRTALAMAE